MLRQTITKKVAPTGCKEIISDGVVVSGGQMTILVDKAVYRGSCQSWQEV